MGRSLGGNRGESNSFRLAIALGGRLVGASLVRSVVWAPHWQTDAGRQAGTASAFTFPSLGRRGGFFSGDFGPGLCAGRAERKSLSQSSSPFRRKCCAAGQNLSQSPRPPPLPPTSRALHELPLPSVACVLQTEIGCLPRLSSWWATNPRLWIALINTPQQPSMLSNAGSSI